MLNAQTASMVRTVGPFAGIGPLTQFDDYSTLMGASFTDRPKYQPYSAIRPTYRMTTLNAAKVEPPPDARLSDSDARAFEAGVSLSPAATSADPVRGSPSPKAASIVRLIPSSPRLSLSERADHEGASVGQAPNGDRHARRIDASYGRRKRHPGAVDRSRLRRAAFRHQRHARGVGGEEAEPDSTRRGGQLREAPHRPRDRHARLRHHQGGSLPRAVGSRPDRPPRGVAEVRARRRHRGAEAAGA